MLAASLFMPPQPQQYPFLPPTPSPLSPRSANIYGKLPTSFMSASGKPEKPQTNTLFAQRNVKKAPAPKQDELKDRRRNAFLRKVKDQREEKKYEARGEDIMRLDFTQRRRQWEADQARLAPQTPMEWIDEDPNDYELLTSSNRMQISTQQSAPEDEIDVVLQREDEELEAMLELMPDAEGARPADSQGSDNLWSDDVDYNALFSEVMEQSASPQAAAQQPQREDAEDMDMS